MKARKLLPPVHERRLLRRKAPGRPKGAFARSIAKSWVVHSFGKSRPQTRWPPEAVKDYKKDTGLNLNEVAKAKDVAKKMLAAFPALKKLEDYPYIWADLQFLEAEAIINTMLILMRKHRVPSLSRHKSASVTTPLSALAPKWV
jgi:hypothetical protein